MPLLLLVLLLTTACAGSPTAPEPVTLWRALSAPCAPTLPLPQVLEKPLYAATDPRVYGYLVGVWQAQGGQLLATFQEVNGRYYICHWQRV